jgi:hypothetical protein
VGVSFVPLFVRRARGKAGILAGGVDKVHIHRVAPHAEVLAGVPFRVKPLPALGGVEPVVAGRTPVYCRRHRR